MADGRKTNEEKAGAGAARANRINAQSCRFKQPALRFSRACFNNERIVNFRNRRRLRPPASPRHPCRSVLKPTKKFSATFYSPAQEQPLSLSFSPSLSLSRGEKGSAVFRLIISPIIAERLPPRAFNPPPVNACAVISRSTLLFRQTNYSNSPFFPLPPPFLFLFLFLPSPFSPAFYRKSKLPLKSSAFVKNLRAASEFAGKGREMISRTMRKGAVNGENSSGGREKKKGKTGVEGILIGWSSADP